MAQRRTHKSAADTSEEQYKVKSGASARGFGREAGPVWMWSTTTDAIIAAIKRDSEAASDECITVRYASEEG